MYLIKTPQAMKRIASDLLWSFDRVDNEVFLTFDDGPTPEITYKILDILDAFDAKATFFCVGKNAASLPRQYSEIQARGHSTGNHTWSHMNGWKNKDFSYFRNIIRCDKTVRSPLFRPPYGRIKPAQIKALKRRYSLIMWDVLSGDWDQAISPETCLQNVVNNTRPGSIVVFHDSLKAEKNMLYALPKSLEILQKRGFVFSGIPEVRLNHLAPA